MPDPSLRRFTAALITLESGYTADARAALSDTRLALLGALQGQGIASPTLPAAFQAEMNALGKRVAGIGRGQAGAVQVASGRLAMAQFEAIRAERHFEPAQVATTEARAANVQLLGSTAWVDALAARLAAETMLLRAGGEPADVAVERLFAVENAGSVWRAGLNDMALRSQLNLWTVGVGLAGLYYAAGEVQSGERWFKEAQAELDDDTTECCVGVDGQVKPLDEPFETSGAPAFAGEQMYPPFHFRCRTGVGLRVGR